MSIQSEIERINNNVQSTLNTIADTGVAVGTNSDALPAAAGALANEKMTTSVYDPQGKEQDIFAYVDEHAANIPVSDTAPTDTDLWIDTNEEANDNYATNETAKGYADTAENNAKAYTDEKFNSIPTPDVSGQIATHNTDTTAHADIREALSGAVSSVETALSGKMATDFSNASAVLSAAMGGTGVTSLAALKTALGISSSAGVQMQIVTRAGTGTYDSANPCSITFSFVPKWVHLIGYDQGDPGIFVGSLSLREVIPSLLTTSYGRDGGFGILQTYCNYVKRSADSKTIYWYSQSSAANQANKSGFTYYFVAFA